MMGYIKKFCSGYEKTHRMLHGSNSNNLEIGSNSARKISSSHTSSKTSSDNRSVTSKVSYNRSKPLSPNYSNRNSELSDLQSAPALCKQVSKSCGVSTDPTPMSDSGKSTITTVANKTTNNTPTKDALLAAAKVLDKITDRLDEKYARLKQENRLLHAELRELQEEQRRIHGDKDCECCKLSDAAICNL